MIRSGSSWLFALVLLAAASGCSKQSTTTRSPNSNSNSDSKRRPSYGYCTCQIWGITGEDPGPDYVPPPRPPECEKILRRGPRQDCPYPA